MTTRTSLLLLHKPIGVTSFSSLKPVKRFVDKKTGHAGTLDRFAEGLMIVLTGAFTKLNPLCSGLDKRYIATISFGEETSTLDPEGKCIAEGPIPTRETIESVLDEQFIGEILQTPPEYSAVHIQGKRAYQLARAGESVDIPARTVFIHRLKILSWESPVLTVEVHCSKGTYIRSLARDIAIACGSRAHLIALKRTAIGPFSLDEAIASDDESVLVEHAKASIDRVSRLPGIGSIVIDAETARRMCYGNLPVKRGIIGRSMHDEDRYAMVFDESGVLLAIVGLDGNQEPNKVFAVVPVENRIDD